MGHQLQIGYEICYSYFPTDISLSCNFGLKTGGTVPFLSIPHLPSPFIPISSPSVSPCSLSLFAANTVEEEEVRVDAAAGGAAAATAGCR